MRAFPKTENETKTVKAKIKKLLDQHGWFHWSPPANGYGSGGISDIHAVWNGVFMVIEAKYGTNKPTATQVNFLKSIMACEHYAFVVTDKNIQWLEFFLEDMEFSVRCVQQGEQVPTHTEARMLDALKEMTALIPETVQ